MVRYILYKQSCASLVICNLDNWGVHSTRYASYFSSLCKQLTFYIILHIIIRVSNNSFLDTTLLAHPDTVFGPLVIGEDPVEVATAICCL